MAKYQANILEVALAVGVAAVLLAAFLRFAWLILTGQLEGVP